MKYAIIYESVGGNTKLVAQSIKTALLDNECIFLGTPNECPKSLDCELFFIGSWCDKGTLSEKMKIIFPLLTNKKVALFGTCGFGKDPSYFERISNNMKSALPKDCTILPFSFVCQGKMAPTVRKRYEIMLKDEQTKVQAEMMIKNFDMALSHPDSEDLNKAKIFANKVMETVCK